MSICNFSLLKMFVHNQLFGNLTRPTIKRKTSKLRISKNDLFMNHKGHILQKGGLIAPNDPPTVRASALDINPTFLSVFILM